MYFPFRIAKRKYVCSSIKKVKINIVIKLNHLLAENSDFLGYPLFRQICLFSFFYLIACQIS